MVGVLLRVSVMAQFLGEPMLRLQCRSNTAQVAPLFSSNCERRTSRRRIAFPAKSTPCSWNTFFAKSTPRVVIFFTGPSPLRYERL